MANIVNMARQIPNQPPPEPHAKQWSFNKNETVWRVDCLGERNKTNIKDRVSHGNGRLRYYFVRDQTRWGTEVPGGDEMVKPELLNRIIFDKDDVEPGRDIGAHVWIYGDNDARERGIIRGSTLAEDGWNYQVTYGRYYCSTRSTPGKGMEQTWVTVQAILLVHRYSKKSNWN